MAKAKEREDYTGPIQDRIKLEEFSKDVLLKLIRLWGEWWESMSSTIVSLGAEMPEVGVVNANELLSRAFERCSPPIYERVADLLKVDKNTIEGRMKATCFALDNANLADHYTTHFKVKSADEAYMEIPHCHVVAKTTLPDVETLRMVCQYVEPRIGLAYMNYPGARKVKIDMVKIPESFEEKPGEPVCIWKLTWEDAEAKSTKKSKSPKESKSTKKA